jgi:hypothetical protein
MNPQLAYQMAQFSQQDIHQASERARTARAASGRSWFGGFRWSLVEARLRRPQPQSTRVIARPIADS